MRQTCYESIAMPEQDYWSDVTTVETVPGRRGAQGYIETSFRRLTPNSSLLMAHHGEAA